MSETRLHGVTFVDARGVRWLSQLYGDHPLRKYDGKYGTFIRDPWWADYFVPGAPPAGEIGRSELAPEDVVTLPVEPCGQA